MKVLYPNSDYLNATRRERSARDRRHPGVTGGMPQREEAPRTRSAAARTVYGFGLTALVFGLAVLPGDRPARGAVDDTAAVAPENEFGYNEGWADRGIGSHHHIRRGGRDRLVRRTAQGGATTNRIPVRWALVQPGNGLKHRCRKRPSEHPAERWRKVDAVYAGMVSRGIRPLLDVGDAPCWAAQPRRAKKPVTQCDRGVGGFPPARPFYGQWQRFVRHVAARYPRALGVEVMNEPNLSLFWGGCPTRNQGKVYGELLRRAYEAVKAVDRAMPVVTAGMAPNKDPGSYLREVFAYGKTHLASNGGLPWDAVAVHAYRSGDDLAAGLSFADSASHQLEVVRRAQAEEQVPGELWVTEVGASTVSNGKGRRDPVFVRGGNRGQKQAGALVDIYMRLREEGVPVIIVSRLVDAPRNDPRQPRRERGAGVLRPGFRPKPAYKCLAALRGVPTECEEYG
jgi:hypothetical protein